MSGGSSSGRGALIISFVSLAVAVASALLSLYYTFLQEPEVSVRLGSPALVNSYGRLGLHCTFINEGAQQAVIISAGVECAEPRVEFKGDLTSESLDKLQFDKGRQKIAEPMKYTLFTPVVVKQRDNANAILWFLSPGHKFSAKKYQCTMKAFESGGSPASRGFELVISDDLMASLADNTDGNYPVVLTQK